MARYEVTHWFSNQGTRQEVRMRVVGEFAKEGSGTEESDGKSRYTYYVETLQSGDRVYLQRPARLHYGFDFLVCVENANYASQGKRRRNFPSHPDICNDLWEKRAADPAMYAKLYPLLKRVYQCDDVEDWESDEISFPCGLPVDHILKVIKWLFIEQDVRYWYGDGRKRTWGGVPEP